MAGYTSAMATAADNADLKARAGAGDVTAQLALAQAHDARGETEMARAWFARAAQAGDAQGLRGLAVSLLTQQPAAPRDGVAMLRQAADRGDAQAAQLCAVLAAQDNHLIGRWEITRRYLDMAAANGSNLAQAQAALLPRDLAPLAIPPKATRIFDEPRIETCAGFASAQECRWLMDRATPRLKAAELYDPASGTGFRGENIRNNRDTSFDLTNSDVIVALLRSRIAAWTGLDLHAMEPPMVLQYQEGQYFAPHRDALDPALPAMAEQIRRQGQRVATVLIYLNDDYQAGETDFPELEWKFKGKAGDALCFWNIDADGQPAARGLHAGVPPLGGEKWVFSQWIRTLP